MKSSWWKSRYVCLLLPSKLSEVCTLHQSTKYYKNSKMFFWSLNIFSMVTLSHVPSETFYSTSSVLTACVRLVTWWRDTRGVVSVTAARPVRLSPTDSQLTPLSVKTCLLISHTTVTPLKLRVKSVNPLSVIFSEILNMSCVRIWRQSQVGILNRHWRLWVQ